MKGENFPGAHTGENGNEWDIEVLRGGLNRREMKDDEMGGRGQRTGGQDVDRVGMRTRVDIAAAQHGAGARWVDGVGAEVPHQVSPGADDSTGG